MLLARKSESGNIFRLVKHIDRDALNIFRLVKHIDRDAFISQSIVQGVYGEGFDQIKT